MRQNVSFTLSEIIQATGGERFSGTPDLCFAGISIDSRTALSSDLFVAIVGEKLDGHDFIRQAINGGVRGILIDKEHAGIFSYARMAKLELGCVVVPDTTVALGRIANRFRKGFDVSVVAITGSNGKTTTKEMTAAVLSAKYKTHKSGGNHNNQIGLPFTLLGLQPWHQWAVVELGMNHPGEIAQLTQICEPDIGVITNVGPGHLEGLGSVEGVLAAKGELLDNMDNKIAVLNLDDKRVASLAEKFPGKTVLFGKGARAQVRAKNVRQTPEGIRFILCVLDSELPVQLHFHGDCMVNNALAAAAVGVIAGVAPEAIRDALEKVTPVKGRQNVFSLPNKVQVIDDTYNANPASFEAAIQTLKALAKADKGRMILVASDMMELGEHSVDAHMALGKWAADAGVSLLYVTGYYAGWTAKGAREAGMKKSQVIIDEKQNIVTRIIPEFREKDWVLVKGSRSTGMNEVVEGLKEAFPCQNII
ncbi:MAG: UDP-N-acetylmuramoyl-tripeptide--D-alanyl-D-alanine ligase [Desulfatibacillum sp.]|nr:UDP-N-acetylmuramoyl-tripeptide--D-alanyl-D-alanine ligase [Desulfatibacillum sp.]